MYYSVRKTLVSPASVLRLISVLWLLVLFPKYKELVLFTNRNMTAVTLLDPCYKLYTTLWNIWIYQLLCKNTQVVPICTSCVFFLTQQLVGLYVSQCCVHFLNSGLTMYWIIEIWMVYRMCLREEKEKWKLLKLNLKLRLRLYLSGGGDFL